jgi:hypothetical protein
MVTGAAKQNKPHQSDTSRPGKERACGRTQAENCFNPIWSQLSLAFPPGPAACPLQTIQAKLSVNPADDEYEREAD